MLTVRGYGEYLTVSAQRQPLLQALPRAELHAVLCDNTTLIQSPSCAKLANTSTTKMKNSKTCMIINSSVSGLPMKIAPGPIQEDGPSRPKSNPAARDSSAANDEVT